MLPQILAECFDITREGVDFCEARPAKNKTPSQMFCKGVCRTFKILLSGSF